MLYKTDLKLTENERLSFSSKIFACYLSSPRLFVLSFVLCLFLSFSVASADSMPSDIIDYLHVDMDTNFTDWRNYESYINQATSVCPYFVRYFVTIRGVNYTIYDFLSSEYLGINSVYINNLYYAAGVGDEQGRVVMTKNNSCILSSSGVCGYRFIIANKSVLCCIMRYENTGTIPSSSSWFSSAYFYPSAYYIHYSPQGDPASSSFSVNISNSICYGDLFVNNAINSFVLIENTAPQYSDDDRLKLYTTQSASKGSLLHVDLSEFYQYNNGVSSNYSFSDVVLTLDCDGTEQSFTLTPSGSQYEFLDTSTSSSRVYGYIVPYSFFSVSQFQNCSVVKVDFSRTVSSPGGSGTEDFRISCSYPLKVTNINGNAQDFAPVTLAPIPSVTVAPDQSTVQDWHNNISYKSSAFGHNGSYVLLNSLPIFPDWVDKYTLDCTRVSKTVDGITLNLWIDLDNPYVSVNTALVDIPITAFFTPESYLKDNVLTDFYDVVVFKVWSDTGKTSVDGYLYFYTEKYDLKYQNNLVVQELSLEYDSLNLLSSGFSLIRTGLDNIDNNTASYFTNSLFNDTVVISWLQTLNNTNAFGFVDVVNAIEDIQQYDDSYVLSGIASVVSAIEGIDTPDLSDLESKLDTLINFFVADGSTANASSRSYRNWLRGVDDTTSRTVTYYADNVFSIVHDVFDLFDADGSVYYPPDSEDVVSTDYINFVKLFIEKMNSSTITNTRYNKYLRGFFQAGFDPHLIDGGL